MPHIGNEAEGVASDSGGDDQSHAAKGVEDVDRPEGGASFRNEAGNRRCDRAVADRLYFGLVFRAHLCDNIALSSGERGRPKFCVLPPWCVKPRNQSDDSNPNE
jgi:hypothetical protein